MTAIKNHSLSRFHSRYKKYWQYFAFLALPLSLFAGAIFETAYFSAIGLRPAAKFLVLFPIPIMESLKISIYLAIAFGFLQLIFILADFSLNTLAQPGKLVAQDLLSLLSRPTMILRKILNGRIGKLAEHMQFTKRPIVVDSVFLKKTLYLIKVLSLGALNAFAWVFIIIPGTLLALKFINKIENPANLATSFIVIVLMFSAMLYSLSFLDGPITLVAIKEKITLRGGIFILMIGVILQFISVGYNSGLADADPSIDPDNARQILQFDSNSCSLMKSPILLRSYSTGSIVLDQDVLIWLPTSGACWGIPVKRHKYVPVKVTPTILCRPIQALTFTTMVDDTDGSSPKKIQDSYCPFNAGP